MTQLEVRLPRDKHDTEAVSTLVHADIEQLQGMYDELLGWMRDLNWPVAKALSPFLASQGKQIAQPVANALKAQDAIWKFWILKELVLPNAELALAIRSELQCLTKSPSEEEVAEGVDALASKILLQLDKHGNA